MNNRIHNSNNPYQGKYKRVLCLCSAGLLRSPSAALVLSQEPYNYNTRAAGVHSDFALVPVDAVLLQWADEIVCVEQSVADSLTSIWGEVLAERQPVIRVLDVPDMYEYREPELLKIIKEQYDREVAVVLR